MGTGEKGEGVFRTVVISPRSGSCAQAWRVVSAVEAGGRCLVFKQRDQSHPIFSADLPGRLSASGQYRQVKEEMALQRPRGENRCLRKELEP